MAEVQVKSKQCVANHGEVFTAECEVKAMCDLVKQKTECIESCFLEPACGDEAAGRVPTDKLILSSSRL